MSFPTVTKNTAHFLQKSTKKNERDFVFSLIREPAAKDAGPTALDGRRRLIKDAVPTLFQWNDYKVEPTRSSVWERTERPPELVHPGDQGQHSVTRDHDYCPVPEPSAEDLSKDVESLRKEIQELHVQREFGLQRFAGSDTDIQFYTRYIEVKFQVFMKTT